MEKEFAMITRKNVRDYRMARGFMKAFVLVLVAMAFYEAGSIAGRVAPALVSLSAMACLCGFFCQLCKWERAARLSVGVTIAAGMAVAYQVLLEGHIPSWSPWAVEVVLAGFWVRWHNRVSDDWDDLFAMWLRLGQPLRWFPVNAMERIKLAKWAEGAVLAPLALALTATLDAREKIQVEEVKPAWDALIRVRDSDESCDPAKISAYRRSVARAKRVVDRADRRYKAADKRAVKKQKEYLTAWDFLIKPEPRGIDILPALRATTPEAFRHRVTKESRDATLKATGMMLPPPPTTDAPPPAV
jgi:hypothetical protein